MKIAIALISFLVLFSSCNHSTRSKTNKEKEPSSTIVRTIQEEEPYSLINDLIMDSLYKTNLLAIETLKFYNTDLDTGMTYDFAKYCDYDNTLFHKLLESNIIDSLDLNGISEQMSKNEQLVWDSTRVKNNTFSFYVIDQLCKNDLEYNPFFYTKKKYNSRNFLILSYPIFLNDNGILLAGSFFCEGLCGHSELYVFGKKNGRWTILYKDLRWFS